MINLDDNQNYYCLIDLQGNNFGGGRIYKGIQELIEQFQDYADMDDYEDPKLTSWTIADCLENWSFELQEYNGIEWIKEYPDGKPLKILNHKIQKTNS